MANSLELAGTKALRVSQAGTHVRLPFAWRIVTSWYHLAEQQRLGRSLMYCKLCSLCQAPGSFLIACCTCGAVYTNQAWYTLNTLTLQFVCSC